ncbi:hypothetical protein [Pseudomonas paraeruginosa]|uniref:hypothetical protein n=1 Tax=Pseudomonas paraeruginosa TaxID=2994495 RepID=UPI0039FC279C|nr:hypothetical protein [Pseudomonas aeruginosa]HCF2412503.1 hypothetical protein [Pseudomonas aeruginosa]
MSHELFIEIRQQPISTSTFADLLDAYGVGEVLCRNIVSRNTQRHYFIGHAYTVECNGHDHRSLASLVEERNRI